MSKNISNNGGKSARERSQEKRQAQLFAFQKNVTIIALLIILVVGLVSTTFSSVLSAPKVGNGSLVVDVQNNVVQSNKSELADIGANIDVVSSGANITSGTVLYLKPNDNWKQSNAWFAAYFFNSSGSKWVAMTQCPNDTGYYKVTAPSGTWSNVIFCRMNPASTSLNWETRWNQSGNLVWDGSKNCCAINSGQWDCGSNVTWSSFTETPDPTDPPTQPPTQPPTEAITYKTIYVGVADHILNESNHNFTPTLHWWNSTKSGDASLTSQNKTANFSVGSSYWNNAEKTFHIYTAQVPDYATSYKLFKDNGGNGDCWANEDLTDYEDGKIILYFHYDIYHNVLADYNTDVTATFKDYNGDVIDTKTVESGATPEKPANPTRTGYTFSKWDPAVGAITKDTTYTAVYTPVNYTITYYVNGAVDSTLTPKNYTIENAVTLPVIQDANGKKFDGWYIDSSCTGTKVSSITKGTYGNKKFYAKYVETFYNLSISRPTNSEIAGGLTVTADGVVVSPTNGVYKLPHGSDVTVKISRGFSKYYFASVSDGSTTSENIYGDCTVSFTNVTDDKTIIYDLKTKPLVTLEFPQHEGVEYDSAPLKYSSDGKVVTENVYDNSGSKSIYVDYGKEISYTLKLKDTSTSYISNITGVVVDSFDATSATGTLASVKSDVSIAPVFSANKTFKLSSSDEDEFDGNKDSFTYTVDTKAYALNSSVQLPYGKSTSIQVVAPEGYYAKILDENNTPLAGVSYSTSVNSNTNVAITTASFTVTVKDKDVEYKVCYMLNPTVAVEQPQYGSIYISSGTGDNTKYYFNGDCVYAGTELTVHVVPDNSNSIIGDICVNGEAIDSKKQECKTVIVENSLISADISLSTNTGIDIAFDDACASGKRRIFFTENAFWGENSVICHYSESTSEDAEIGSIAMTFKYVNTSNQRVYYADIPLSAAYVKFSYDGDDTKFTDYLSISKSYNGFYISTFKNGKYNAVNTWNFKYSDFVAIDREYTAQQAIIKKNESAVFEYTSDFGDSSLKLEVLDGDGVDYTFSDGYLDIKPNTQTEKFSLVKVTSPTSSSVKIYLIKISELDVKAKEIQKIFPLNAFLTLSGKFEGGLLKTIQYNVSTNNFPYAAAYSQLAKETITNNTSTEYEYSYKVEQAFNGVRYFKVFGVDNLGDTASVTQKTVFGSDSSVGTGRMVYFKNDAKVNMNKYCVRACFESVSGDRSWVTMQKLKDAEIYRANVPDDCSYQVSIYLTHKKRYANLKSDEDGFKYICYYYNENIVLPEDYSPIYLLKELYSNREMKLVLQE